MKTVSVAVTEEVKAVLAESTFTADRVVLPGRQLDRKLYESVNKVLSNLGGTWNRKAQAHLFSCDPREKLQELLSGGQLIDKKKTFQAFYTPAGVADLAVSLLDIEPEMLVLEPSAGDGALIKALKRAEPKAYSIAVEIDAEQGPALSTLANRVRIADFLTIQHNNFGHFSRVLMNPPFTDGQDVAHVTHAFDFLHPGGKLVAIMAPSFEFRTGVKYDKFRALFDEFGTYKEDLPEGAFKESGTNVRTVLVVLEKPSI